VSDNTPDDSIEARRRLRVWRLARRRSVALIATALVIALIVVVVVNPFARPSSKSNGFSANSYPTSIATVKLQTLTSQTQVSATLGYAGNHVVSLPSGTPSSTIAQVNVAAQSAHEKVVQDTAALADARRVLGPSDAETLSTARSLVASDQAALDNARSQLSSDLSLGCPGASSATVTALALRSPALARPTTPSVPTALDTTPSAQPDVTTGPVDDTLSTSTVVTGSIDPNGAATTYYVEYGTGPNYGNQSSSVFVGDGTSSLAVEVALTGLVPGSTYDYRLVAQNSLGTSYGQGADFATSSPPSATTGPAASVSSTSESLAGTLDPSGVSSTYYFEWGSSSLFGNVTAIQSAGSGFSPVSVAATISGLNANTSYDYALVVTNALGAVTGSTQTFTSAQSSCVAQTTVVQTDSTAVAEAKDALRVDELGRNLTVSQDQNQLANDEIAASSAEQALALAQRDSTNPAATITSLPAVGAILHRGQAVYALDGRDVPLFYGTVTPFRALYDGESGPDVRQLQVNLKCFGFGSGLRVGGDFDGTTQNAVREWQRSLGMLANGIVALGDYVVEPTAIEVESVAAARGEAVQSGMKVLEASSTARLVTIALDADEQNQVKVGDAVTVTLPDQSTTPGVVSSVGAIALAPPANSEGGSSTPTITVRVTLTDPSAAGHLDDAPVNVAITNGSVANAFVVPVDALLALANGGYALEVVSASGTHSLEAVTTGLFDDADELVQVSGSSVAAGQRVVVPKA
jgi:hypothetical protein